jgi:phage repressor protein C with HTH and peptisase S24 domain
MARGGHRLAEKWKEIEELISRVPKEELAKGAGISLDTLRRYKYQEVSDQVMQSLRTAAGYWELRQAQKAGSDVSVVQEVRPAYALRRKAPVVGFVAGADLLSNRSFNYSDLSYQIEETIETDCRDPNALGLIVEGDSMEPEYLAGDRIIVAPNSEPRNRDIVVARLVEDGAAMLKRFFQNRRTWQGDSPGEHKSSLSSDHKTGGGVSIYLSCG